MPMRNSKWVVPGFAVVIGATLFVAELIGHHPGEGVFDVGLFAALAAVFAFGGRSETIRSLRGDGSDERSRSLDILALAAAGTVLIFAVVIAFIVELARGHDGNPFTWLAALAGFTYLAAEVWLRVRR